MNPLLHKIIEYIKAHGFIDVHTFMEMALYDQNLGYYFTQNVIGKNGDYITSPEISQVFGEILACWFINQWYSNGQPKALHLIELGPGRGTLMMDMLRVFSKHEEFWNALKKIFLVEISPLLREKQKGKLNTYSDKIFYLDHIKQYESDLSTTTFIIANEFFDALPIEQFTYNSNAITERKIIINDVNQLEFEQTDNIDIQEFCPDYQKTMEHICKNINSKGAALIIDYGFDDQHLSGDSLQGLHRNQYVDILGSPGEVDLSHHVNFAKLVTYIPPSFGVEVSSQEDFLNRHGIIERTESLAAKLKNSFERNHLLSATARLTMPQHMGKLFKVMQIISPP